MPCITLDNTPVDADSGSITVGDVLTVLQDEARRGERLITTVECDGRALHGDELSALLTRSIRSIDTLHMRTESQRTLVLTILRQSAEVMGQAQSLRMEIADQLSQGRTAEAMQGLMSFIGVWGQTYTAVTQCAAALDVCLDDLSIEDEPVTAHISGVTGLLRDVKQALADRDHVRLADQMAYELGPALEACQHVLHALIERAERR